MALRCTRYILRANTLSTYICTTVCALVLICSGEHIHVKHRPATSRPDQSRIFDPGTNEYISSRYDVRSTFRNDVGKADKLDADVQQSSTDEWNTASSIFEEGSPESIFRKVVKTFDSSKRMNLANSLNVQTPELVSFRHTPMQTENVGERRSDGVATRIANKYGIWKPTLSYIETATTHGDVESRSEKLAYSKFIKDPEFETSKVFEQENIKERENFRNIETQLRMTRIDKQKIKNIFALLNIFYFLFVYSSHS